MPKGHKLSHEDVLRLLKDPSAENRAVTARKLGSEFDADSLDPAARRIAEDIFRAMVKDAEVMVREALAESLKDNPEIPHDVAVTLAHDVARVATPILECSEVLTEEELVEIVHDFDTEHQMAVARRETVSETLAEALVETRDEDVVATLVANEGAEISEMTMNTVVDQFGTNARIQEPLIRRNKLPLMIAERLVSLVSENLREQIVTHHEISPDLATDLVLESRERATVSLLSPTSTSADVLDLVNELHQNGRLTPTLILRALCMGDMAFFETALAIRANIPLRAAFMLIDDDGELGLATLFDRAGMPAEMLDLARVAVAVKKETDYDGGDNDRERFRHRMIERVLTKYESGIDPENLDYFISKLGAGQAQPRAHA